MPIASIAPRPRADRGVAINYEVLGDRARGSRCSRVGGAVRRRQVVRRKDRRGWQPGVDLRPAQLRRLERLVHRRLRKRGLGRGPARTAAAARCRAGVIGGSSSGCRLALLFASRHPAAARGLVIVAGHRRAPAAERLAQNYDGHFIEIARLGGMSAGCLSEHFSEVIAANPANRALLMNMDRQESIALMERWQQSFNDGAEHPVLGLSPAEMRAMTTTACIIPGTDGRIRAPSGRRRTGLCRTPRYRRVLTEDDPDLDAVTEAWEPKEGFVGRDLYRLHPPPRAPPLSAVEASAGSAAGQRATPPCPAASVGNGRVTGPARTSHRRCAAGYGRRPGRRGAGRTAGRARRQAWRRATRARR